MRFDSTSRCLGALCLATGFVVGSVFLRCTARTTGIDASEEQLVNIDSADNVEVGDKLVDTSQRTEIAGPTGETAAVGTGAQVSQITTGNIALGGGWLAVPLVMFALLVARHRRLAVERMVHGIEFVRPPDDHSLISGYYKCRQQIKGRIRLGGLEVDQVGGQCSNAPGRVIARAVKRVTKK